MTITMMASLACRLLALVLLLPSSTMAEFGDYADSSFSCPATTTCPQICVPRGDLCPPEMQCPEGEMLCADGSCAALCNPDLVSPCDKDCAAVACPKYVTTYDVCLSEYKLLYEYAADCDMSYVYSSATLNQGPSFGWTDPIFIALYAWLIGVSVGIVAWCWYNHRIDPVEDSTKILQISALVHASEEKDATFQTGYKRTSVGILLHYWTLATYIGWMGLLAGVSYVYMNSLDDDEDLIMSLKVWAVVWNLGLFWSFVLKWPKTIQSIFLRRCLLSEATQVAIYHKMGTTAPEVNDEEDSIFPKAVQGIAKVLDGFVNSVMTAIFADPGARPDPKKGILQYCPVCTNPDGSRYFVFLFRRYNFDEEKGMFFPGSWVVGRTFREIAPDGVEEVDDIELSFERAMNGDTSDIPARASVKHRVNASGLSKKEVDARYRAIGPNLIDMVEPSFLRSCGEECMKPFYVYQFYILWIWITTQYWHMAIVNWGIIISTICIVSLLKFKGACVLYGLSKCTGKATVLREGIYQEIDQKELVPGDIVKLEPGLTYCDLLLLTGEAILDESALTGEATPQAKAPIDLRSSEVYDPKLHKKKSISAGTKVLECEDALAVVINTASYTMKGELLRDIIAFRHYTPKMESQIPLVVAVLVGWSSVLFFLVYFNSGDISVISWTLGMTAFANCFPALLPISFTVPVGISFNRLSKSRIACSNSDSILIAGKVSKAFFDKTGTLTKQGLDFVSARSAESWDYGLWMSDSLSLAMTVCHALTMSAEGIIIGNPVDRAMFASTKATLEDHSGVSATIKDKKGNIYEIIRRFDFDHNTMTQSVIVQLPNGDLKAIVKGSGESVNAKCQQDTVPKSYAEKLSAYSKNGVYQIAVGWKDLPPNTSAATVTRDEVESELEFLGLLNFSNQMREETPDMIKELNEADVQPIMLTGDNLFTGIHVARKSGIIPKAACVNIGQLNGEEEVAWSNEEGDCFQDEPMFAPDDPGYVAMSGEAWCHLLHTKREYAISLAPSIHVVGRCSPQDKVSVVDTFVSLNHVTAMVGDGGNDCGALKAAHVGLALSDSDASIVAPFTSLDKDISSVSTLLKEGRAALASTVATYKYVILYGQITSYNQLIMYYLSASFSEWMWTLIDGFWTVSFTLTLPLSLPAGKLSKSRPTSSIFGWQTVSSVMGIMGINFIFITIAFAVLYSEDWFQCRKWDVDQISTANILQTSDNYEITLIFLITGFQCLCSAMTMNFGYEFRRWWGRNWIFATLSIVFTFIHFWITLVPGELSCIWRVNCDNEDVVRSVTSPDLVAIFNPFNTTVMPESFRWKLIFIMVGNGVSVALYDYFVVNGIRRWKAAHRHEKAAREYEMKLNSSGRTSAYASTVDGFSMDGSVPGPNGSDHNESDPSPHNSYEKVEAC